MNYEQAMEYIHAVQWAGHKPGLTRTRTLLAALGDPHKKLQFVHVAGTNGKGSTAAMLASCLQAAGYRVGLYTSPFINRFNERIQINGQQIPDEALVELVEQVKPAADAMEDVPTEFEIITALGMLYFAQQQCDIVVLEVGLGGTLDSTNVIEKPACAVITAHGMRATVQSLKDRFPGQKFVFLVSIMADKDVDEMLALLAPLAERFVTVTAHNPRAMPAQTLAEHIRAYGCTAEAADSIEAGVARAEELGGEGPVCALGTLYFSGDVRQAFAKINKA